MKIFIVALILALPLANLAAQTLRSELEVLRENYNRAVERVVEPIRTTYEAELEKMLAQTTQSGDFEEAKKIAEELKTVRDTAQLAKAFSKDDMMKFFVGKSWWSPARSEYHFNQDGTGYRSHPSSGKTPMTWEINTPGVVEAKGAMSEGGAIQTWFFSFTNDKTALFGRRPDVIKEPLTAK